MLVETFKKEAIEAITHLPETATVDDVMYRLYVLDKIRKGKEAVARGETISVAALRTEKESW
ncbi:MAG: hypothetical protein HYZ34_05335 [Ignavibacteriae bacterium]|nr:hypothetical protein [Ignavibacteriota bacterium]